RSGANRTAALRGVDAADLAELVPELLGEGEHPARSRAAALDTLPPEQARFRLFDAVAAFFKNASAQHPFVLLLDDLHWADKPSLLLLQFLAREMRDSRVLIVGTYRDVEVGRKHPLGAVLAELAREPTCARVVLRGLSEEEVAR